MSSEFNRLAGKFEETFSSEDLDGKVVLDIACGIGIWGHLLRALTDLTDADCYLVGCDGFRAYLKKSRTYSPYDDVVLCDVRKLPFRTQASDFTIAFEIIEHLNKQEGFAFLVELQEITRHKIVVSTPYGHYEQGVKRNNRLERHISAWYKYDFESRGFMVKTCGFGNELEKVLVNLHLTDLWRMIAKSALKMEYGGIMLFAIKKIGTSEKAS